MPRCEASANVTAGLKCAPEIGPEREYQCYQRRTGGHSIGKESDGDVAASQPLPHNAGADDRREEQGGSQGFGNNTARDRHQAQQPGAQQAADFVARTKALMNLPSISFARASASRP